MKEKTGWDALRDKYVIHADTEIRGFISPYRWLSNFHLCEVEYEGIVYPSAENAYQAAKIETNQREAFVNCTPAESKLIWKKLTRIDISAHEWDARKNEVMRKVVKSKFERNPSLAKMLKETGDKHLEERNYWGDVHFGVDIRRGGQNWLGKILMEVRGSL